MFHVHQNHLSIFRQDSFAHVLTEWFCPSPTQYLRPVSASCMLWCGARTCQSSPQSISNNLRLFDAILVHFPADAHVLPIPSQRSHLYPNETSYLLYLIPVRNLVKTHTGRNVLYRDENRSKLVPVLHFVPVSCKWIQSYMWEPGWTRTGMKLVPVSCKHPPYKTVAFSPLVSFYVSQKCLDMSQTS